MSWVEVRRRYDVEEGPVDIGGGLTLPLARVRDINALIDAMGPGDFDDDERLPYWATLWPAAKALALQIIAAPPEGPMLELGAGLGLVSVAAAVAGIEVTATDYEADSLAFIARNAALNQVSVATQLWDWRATDAPALHRTVVAADVLYEQRNVDPVMSAIDRVLAPGGTAIIADPGRPHVSDFGRALIARGYSADIICTDDIMIMYAMRSTAPS